MLQKAAAYIRVSTEDQTEFSPDAQLKAIKKYCNDNSIILENKHIYIDEGISGRKANIRPAFQNMIKYAKNREFNLILVHKFDRFARSREDSVVYKSLLKKEYGIRVISITETIDDDKFSIILEAMLEAMAEYYSVNLSEEVKKGMTEKAQRGQFQAAPPFGYKMENKNLVVLDNEAKAVKLIFNDFLSGLGFLEIAKKINQLGFLTHRGNKFENRTIEYILKNPVYVGMTRWTSHNKNEQASNGLISSESYKQSCGYWASNSSSKQSCSGWASSDKSMPFYSNTGTILAKSSHEAIIDYSTFTMVQEKLAARKKLTKKYYKGVNSKHLHWLNGLVHCQYCGSTFVRNQGDYYNCNGYSKGKCSMSQNIKISLIESAVLKQIKIDFPDAVTFLQESKISFNNDVEIILSQLKKISEKEIRAKNAYLSGVDSLAEYEKNKNALQSQRINLEKYLQKLKSADRQDKFGVLKIIGKSGRFETSKMIEKTDKFKSSKMIQKTDKFKTSKMIEKIDKFESSKMIEKTDKFKSSKMIEKTDKFESSKMIEKTDKFGALKKLKQAENMYHTADNHSAGSPIKSKSMTIYEILTSNDISMREKHVVSHFVIENIILEKNTSTLFLTYKYHSQ